MAGGPRADLSIIGSRLKLVSVDLSQTLHQLRDIQRQAQHAEIQRRIGELEDVHDALHHLGVTFTDVARGSP